MRIKFGIGISIEFVNRYGDNRMLKKVMTKGYVPSVQKEGSYTLYFPESTNLLLSVEGWAWDQAHNILRL